MDSTQFYGVHTAMVTPMRDLDICYESTSKLIEAQIEGGVQGLVAVGTTGESPTLDHEEHMHFIRFVVSKVKGRVPVMAGTGSNSTREAIHLTEEASRAGADAMLVVAPYYNKPSQEGLFGHLSAVAEVTDKPIILYSIPGRCGIEIGVDTVARLHEKHSNVIGIKEAGGSCERVCELVQALGEDFLILSGDDSLTLPFMACGARGVISVASNLIPGVMSEMVSLALKNDMQAATKIHTQYYKLFKHLFIEPNPVPAKQAMADMGLISSNRVRRPLCPMTPDNHATLTATLKELGLL